MIKHIAFLYTTPIIPLKGGVERVTHILAQEFISRGIRVSNISFIKPETEEYEYVAPQYFFPTRYPDSEENRRFLTDFVNRECVDVLIFQNTGFYGNKFPFDLYPLNDNCSLFNVIHNDPARGINFFWHNRLHRQGKIIPYILAYIPKFILGFIRKRQALSMMKSEFLYSYLNSDSTVLLSDKYIQNVKKYISEDVLKINVINNPRTYPLIYNEDNKENIILFVGRLTGNKQCDHVIQSWNKIAEKYKDWKLIILGDGPQRNYLESLIKYPEQTELKGVCNPDEYYSRAKILCMASGYEGWPMVLTEGMSSGCVPIAYRSFASVVDIIDDGINGMLVQPFDRGKYASVMEQLIVDESYRKELAQRAVAKMRPFSPEDICDRWLELFNSLDVKNDRK